MSLAGAGNSLVVFVKEPRPGAVKTRLAAAVGPELAARLYRALAEIVLESTAPLADEYERLVFFDPPDARLALRAWLPGVTLRAQGEGELGERMAAAFRRGFARGARRVAIVGTDAPGLTRATVLQSFGALDEADVVLGPAEDGGYYLIALREPQPELLRGIDWSTPRVLAQTLERAASVRLTVRQLDPQRDVDTLADLRSVWPVIAARLAGHSDLLRALERALALAG